MTKRPAIDLSALTSETAAPMTEAVQRFPTPPAEPVVSKQAGQGSGTAKTEELEPLAFKVSPKFRKRFRERAFNADLKLNELLFEALTAWEEKHGYKS